MSRGGGGGGAGTLKTLARLHASRSAVSET